LLFLREVVGERKAFLWPEVANAINRYFCYATRQDLSQPQRALSIADLKFMKTVWFEGAEDGVTALQIETFWKWFSQVLRNLRYQRYLINMWTMRLIFGFADRTEVDRQLAAKVTGAFILRFSQNSQPGSIVIAFKTADVTKPVKNYLIKPEDIKGRTLPDFLRTRNDLRYILQSTNIPSPDETPILREFLKEEVLPGNTVKANTAQDGYDDDLH